MIIRIWWGKCKVPSAKCKVQNANFPLVRTRPPLFVVSRGEQSGTVKFSSPHWEQQTLKFIYNVNETPRPRHYSPSPHAGPASSLPTPDRFDASGAHTWAPRVALHVRWARHHKKPSQPEYIGKNS